jgi:hypothetical protein
MYSKVKKEEIEKSQLELCKSDKIAQDYFTPLTTT